MSDAFVDFTTGCNTSVTPGSHHTGDILILTRLYHLSVFMNHRSTRQLAVAQYNGWLELACALAGPRHRTVPGQWSPPHHGTLSYVHCVH